VVSYVPNEIVSKHPIETLRVTARKRKFLRMKLYCDWYLAYRIRTDKKNAQNRVTQMALKIINNFDGNFTLDTQAKEDLFQLLKNKAFLSHICQQINCERVEFTELLFQPVPYSLNTPKGMPKEFEQYHESEEFAIINIPPNFMFKAKVFNPSRLCAIYKKC
jgi:cellulose biosynthesis protein BcsQ